MASGGRVSIASLERQISELSRQIFEIDIKIQNFKKTQTNLGKIPDLNAAKFSLQRDIVDLEIQKTLQKAKNRKRRN